MCNVNNMLAAYVRTINGRVNVEVLFDIVFEYEYSTVWIEFFPLSPMT